MNVIQSMVLVDVVAIMQFVQTHLVRLRVNVLAVLPGIPQIYARILMSARKRVHVELVQFAQTHLDRINANVLKVQLLIRTPQQDVMKL